MSRSDEVRARQQAGGPVSEVDARNAAVLYLAELKVHDDHTWQQVGPCVYCVDCNKRLFQGTIGKSHEKVLTKSWDAARDPEKTKSMRERWRKA